jgi:hypothetical protein
MIASMEFHPLYARPGADKSGKTHIPIRNDRNMGFDPPRNELADLAPLARAPEPQRGVVA